MNTRLEYLREQIRKENISYEEIAELESMAEQIPEGDVELREWAGISEKLEVSKITDIIYDTLMDNAHEKLDLNIVKDQEVEADRGRISFVYQGKQIELSIKIIN